MKVTETIRRSVTIRPSVDTRVRDLIAACARYRISMDYTSALNLLAELGENWLENSTRKDRKEAEEIWSRYLDYEKFEKSVVSDWVELEEFRQWKEEARAIRSQSEKEPKSSA